MSLLLVRVCLPEHGGGFLTLNCSRNSTVAQLKDLILQKLEFQRPKQMVGQDTSGWILEQKHGCGNADATSLVRKTFPKKGKEPYSECFLSKGWFNSSKATPVPLDNNSPHLQTQTRRLSQSDKIKDPKFKSGKKPKIIKKIIIKPKPRGDQQEQQQDQNVQQDGSDQEDGELQSEDEIKDDMKEKTDALGDAASINTIESYEEKLKLMEEVATEQVAEKEVVIRDQEKEILLLKTRLEECKKNF